MTQGYLCMSFPLKSAADAKAVAQELPPLMADLFRAEMRSAPCTTPGSRY